MRDSLSKYSKANSDGNNNKISVTRDNYHTISFRRRLIGFLRL